MSSLSRISHYRNEIMGVAILWVMVFHSNMDFPRGLLPFNVLKSIGYGGVDLFFFLSGFSLFCGWSLNHYSRITFYWRRLVRILPPYWIIVIIYLGIKCVNTMEIHPIYLFKIFTGLNFFLDDDKFFWFVPSILFCYLLFPYIATFTTITNDAHISSELILMSIAVILISPMITMTHWYYLLILTIRIPIFIFGIYAGYIFVNKKHSFMFEGVVFNLVILLSGLLALGIIIMFTTPEHRWRFGLWWYPFVIMAYPICMLMAASIQYIEGYSVNNRFLKSIIRMLRFCGQYSLEIYLVHVLIFDIFPARIKSILPSLIENSINKGRIIEYSIYMLLAILISPILSKLSSFFKMFILTAQRSFTERFESYSR